MPSVPVLDLGSLRPAPVPGVPAAHPSGAPAPNATAEAATVVHVLDAATRRDHHAADRAPHRLEPVEPDRHPAGDGDGSDRSLGAADRWSPTDVHITLATATDDLADDRADGRVDRRADRAPDDHRPF